MSSMEKFEDVVHGYFKGLYMRESIVCMSSCVLSNDDVNDRANKGKGIRFKDGMVAVSQFRMFFSFVKKGKVKVEHLLQLVSIVPGVEVASYLFTFWDSKRRKVYYTVKNTTHDMHLIESVRESYFGFASEWNSTFLYKLRHSPPLIWRDKYKPCGGFVHTYLAFCNMLNVNPVEQFVSYVKDVDKFGEKTLNLNQACGIYNNNTDTKLQLEVVGYALSLTNYFEHINLVGIQREDAIPLIESALRYNISIVSFTISNTRSLISADFGNALLHNPANSVQSIDISGNYFTADGETYFSKYLAKRRKKLYVLNLENCEISKNGVSMIIDSLRKNWGLSAGIEELNLSGNTINTSELKDLLNAIRPHSQLKRLSVANGNIQVGELITAIDTYPLIWLDLSNNKMSKTNMVNLIGIGKLSSSIQVLKISNIGITTEYLVPVLYALFQNEYLSDLWIDISRNDIEKEGADQIEKCLRLANNLYALDISKNRLGAIGVRTVVNSLPLTVGRLILDDNITHNDVNLIDATESIGKLLQTNRRISHLSVAGSEDYFGSSLSRFFRDLKHSSVVELNISGNQIGDFAFSILMKSIKKSRSLKCLKFDGNMLSLNSYLSLDNILNTNYSLTYIEYPIKDLTQNGISIQFLQVVSSITSKLERNGVYEDFNNFEFKRDRMIPSEPSSILIFDDLPNFDNESDDSSGFFFHLLIHKFVIQTGLILSLPSQKEFNLVRRDPNPSILAWVK
eukprot:TRINITY_DN2518_c0_g1_i4.p1 TRINITY_DN2518_c0_g1~~TRINITY_DN2518_c0_g1_i4.p1  ORF type:complete len:738 (-),score=116.85 TRINITY_DN2518_c0_g1_i4:1218-3431(-)